MRWDISSSETVRSLGGVVGLLALSLAVGTVAYAREPSGKARELRLAPIAFRPANSSASYAVEEGGLGRLCPSKGAGYFVAPLRFADGTVIERITVSLEDTSPTSFGMLSLVRRGPQDFEMLAFTPVSTGTRPPSAGTDAIETLSTDAISAPAVDNALGSYLLQVVLSGPGVCLHGATVRYRTP